jgi:glycosyltransferase involved in cell wall biosynthesis
VVTDAPGVRDYVEDGQTGLIVPPDPAALADTLRWALDPAHRPRVMTIGQQARDVVRERFTASRYVDDLLAVTSAALNESPASLSPGT